MANKWVSGIIVLNAIQSQIKRVLLAVAQRSSQHSCMFMMFSVSYWSLENVLFRRRQRLEEEEDQDQDQDQDQDDEE